MLEFLVKAFVILTLAKIMHYVLKIEKVYVVIAVNVILPCLLVCNELKIISFNISLYQFLQVTIVKMN